MDEISAHQEKSNAATASIVTALVLTTMKLSVGFYTNSLGILSEALHSGLDMMAAILTLFAVRIAARPADAGHTYGYGKVENLAALAETALLLLTCGWILGEAVERLFYHSGTVLPSLWGVVVMGISMALDFHRVRLLRKVAKKHNSRALEADALHFSSDILSSGVVLVGLLVIWFAQYLPADSPWRPVLNSVDAFAALLVSLIVLHACYKLARKAVHDLMDGGSQELRQGIEDAVRSVPGIVQVGRIRLRTSGPSAFVDLAVGVSPRLSVESGHRITREAEERIQAVLPGADVTIHVEPQGQSETDNPLRILQNCAAQHEVSIHGLQLLDIPGGLRAELHAEVPGTLSLYEAHTRVTAFEKASRDLLPGVEIVSHVEPEGRGAWHSTCPLPCKCEEVDTLTRQVEVHMARQEGVFGCHRLVAYRMPVDGVQEGLALSFHCRMAADTTVEAAHEAATRLERHLRQALPQLARVVIHMEPDPPLHAGRATADPPPDDFVQR